MDNQPYPLLDNNPAKLIKGTQKPGSNAVFTMGNIIQSGKSQNLHDLRSATREEMYHFKVIKDNIIQMASVIFGHILQKPDKTI